MKDEQVTTPALNRLAELIHRIAREKGFYEKEKNIGEMLALIHSEVSEALEADRKGRYMNHSMDEINSWVGDEDFTKAYKERVKGTFEEEMADIIIRVLDLCAYKNIDINGQIKAKVRYNSQREKYHGKKY